MRWLEKNKCCQRWRKKIIRENKYVNDSLDLSRFTQTQVRVVPNQICLFQDKHLVKILPVWLKSNRIYNNNNNTIVNRVIIIRVGKPEPSPWSSQGN